MAKSVLVIGGGPAGLGAARILGRLGIPTILLEKEDRLGGNPVLNHYHTLIPRKLKPEQVTRSLHQGGGKQPQRAGQTKDGAFRL
jgi:heterodisulfide reductase subunit A2